MNKRKHFTPPHGAKVTHIDIKITNAATFHAVVADADFIVVDFSRKEVESGLTGDAIDRLMMLSDSKDHVLKFKSAISFSFNGYEHDKREVYEIPECVQFMRKVTESWPFWMHFVETRHETFLILVLLLCKHQVVERSKGMVGASPDIKSLGVVLHQLFDGLNEMYESYELPNEMNIEITDAVLKTLNLPGVAGT